jgi:hypothetical protein
MIDPHDVIDQHDLMPLLLHLRSKGEFGAFFVHVIPAKPLPSAGRPGAIFQKRVEQ